MSKLFGNQWEKFEYSKHAQGRVQGRGIDDLIIHLVRTYGKRGYSRRGMTYSMDKAARRRVQKALGYREYKRVEPDLGKYLVFSLDGKTLITVAHRTRRLRSR